MSALEDLIAKATNKGVARGRKLKGAQVLGSAVGAPSGAARVARMAPQNVNRLRDYMNGAAKQGVRTGAAGNVAGRGAAAALADGQGMAARQGVRVGALGSVAGRSASDTIGAAQGLADPDEELRRAILEMLGRRPPVGYTGPIG